LALPPLTDCSHTSPERCHFLYRQPLAIFEALQILLLAGEAGFCRLLDTLGGIRGVSASGSDDAALASPPLPCVTKGNWNHWHRHQL